MRQKYHAKLLTTLFVLLMGTQLAIAQYTVTGTVTDETTGEVLTGVNIFEAVSGSGASTNIDGKYSIVLPTGTASLRVSFIGYLTQNIEVSGGNGDVVELNIQIKADVANLDELVVTGLASSIKRSNLANSVTKIDAGKLTEKAAAPTLDNAFMGKIPGVSIKTQGGAPGGGINVQMRGISTLGAGSSQPLYIIDGVYLNNEVISTSRGSAIGAGGNSSDDANRLADINPEDIASIEVLKGPSAAAIYGQRANAGVILITTKRGQSGKTKINFSQDVGFVSALNLLGVAEWNDEKIDVFTSIFGGNATTEKAAYNAAKNAGNLYDYEKEIYGNKGLISQTSIGISGGNDKTNFYLSGTIRGEDGIIKNTGFERNSVRLNLDHRLNDRIKLASRSTYTHTSNQRGFTGNQNGTGGSLGYNISYVPTYAQLQPNSDGEFPDNPYFSENPLSIVENAVNDQTVQRFIQGLQLTVDLVKNETGILSLRADGGVDYVGFTSLVYMPTFLQYQSGRPDPGVAIHSIEDNYNTNVQASLNYVTNFKVADEDLQSSTNVGISRFDQNQNRTVVLGRGLLAGETGVANANIQSISNQTKVKVADLSWFGQQQLNWGDKLIATLGGRLDRSSLNFSQDEYYFYPKASLAVNLSNFDFLDGSIFNQLKPRIAYGETGGLPNFGVIYSALNAGNLDGGLGTTVSTRSIDPTLKPERARELEFGADISLLDNRVSIEASYYIKKVEDLILDERLPTSSGISLVAKNAANLENKGLELSVALNPVRTRDLNWVTTVLFWNNESKITDLFIPAYNVGGFGTGLGTYLIQEGFSPSTIIANPAVSTPSLFTVYGNSQPDFEMSWSNEFNIYNNFDFSFLWHWKKGGDNINLSLLLTDEGGTSADWNEGVETADVANGVYPKGADRLINGGSGAYIEDASYLKLREVGLYYTVPVETISKLFGDTVQRIKLGASGNNLLMFTPYRSYDPETSAFGIQAVNSSVEVTPYPTSRQVMFHVNIDF